MNEAVRVGELRPSRAARRLVLAALVTLLVPGLVGFEAWPLTAWRLFSLSRDERQTAWLLEASAVGSESRTISLEELPLRFRHAAWPMSELPGASQQRREEVCQALLGATLRVMPDLTELRIVRDRQMLVRAPTGWVVSHGPETIHGCLPAAEP